MLGVILALLVILGAVSVEKNSEYNSIGVSKHIPRLIFRSHEDPIPNLHYKFTEFLNRTTTENTQYVQIYFDANDRVEFIKKYYPQYLVYYNSLVPGAYKSDMWRYLVIFKYGGIYNDMGMRFVKAINKVISFEKDEFVGAVDLDPTAIINGFFAAYPGHPILRKTIEFIVGNIKNYRYGCDNIDITGPRAFGRAYRLFFYSRPYALKPVKVGKYVLSHCNPHARPPAGSQSPAQSTISSTADVDTGSRPVLYKIHFLNFSLSTPSHQHRTAKSVWDRVQLISEDTGEVCVKNKFDGYLEAIYNRSHSGTVTSTGRGYGNLWTRRQVYRARARAVGAAQHAGGKAQSDTGSRESVGHGEYLYSDNLFKQGRGLWYLHNLTKFTFPDYQTFLDMGLQECMAVDTISGVAASVYSKLPETSFRSTTGVNGNDNSKSTSRAFSAGALDGNIGAVNLWGIEGCNTTGSIVGTGSTIPWHPQGGAPFEHSAVLKYVQRLRSKSEGGAGGLLLDLRNTLTYQEFDLFMSNSKRSNK